MEESAPAARIAAPNSVVFVLMYFVLVVPCVWQPSQISLIMSTGFLKIFEQFWDSQTMDSLFVSDLRKDATQKQGNWGSKSQPQKLSRSQFRRRRAQRNDKRQ